MKFGAEEIQETAASLGFRPDSIRFQSTLIAHPESRIMRQLVRAFVFVWSVSSCTSSTLPPASAPEPAPAPATSPVAAPVAATVAASSPVERRVELESSGWKLVGDFLVPAVEHPVPGVLLLHRAAGSRDEYLALAHALARRGVASLRLDLRACGESINLGRFEEPFAKNLRLLDGTYEDVEVALRWLAAQPSVDGKRLAAVGASYSGEAIGEALRSNGTATKAYVMLSPGSFSDASIAAVQTSSAAWLFVSTTEESPMSREHLDAIFKAIARDAKSAEIEIIEGAGHATHILEQHPSTVDHIADWLATRLGATHHEGNHHDPQ